MRRGLAMMGLSAALCVAGCGDDTTEGAAGGGTGDGGSGGGGTTSGGEGGEGGGSSTSTPEAYAEAFCGEAASGSAVAIDGQATPPAVVELDTLYEMPLETVNAEGPLEYVGRGTLTVTTPGRYLALAFDLSGDTSASYVTIGGDGVPESTACGECSTACDVADQGFVYDLPAGTYEVALSDSVQQELRFIIAALD